jgi:hypothetical protein
MLVAVVEAVGCVAAAACAPAASAAAVSVGLAAVSAPQVPAAGSRMFRTRSAVPLAVAQDGATGLVGAAVAGPVVIGPDMDTATDTV